MMNDVVQLTLAWLAGTGLGAIFFGGLWWTVRKGLSSRQPALWFLGSLLLRIGTTLVGFYYVALGSWVRLMLCLFGFLVARLVVTWLTRPKMKAKTGLAGQAHHAP